MPSGGQRTGQLTRCRASPGRPAESLPELVERRCPRRLLVEGIDRQSAEQLGVEVGGFLGHDFAGEGNVADLRHAAGIHQESDVGTRPLRCAPATKPRRRRERRR